MEPVGGGGALILTKVDSIVVAHHGPPENRWCGQQMDSSFRITKSASVVLGIHGLDYATGTDRN